MMQIYVIFRRVSFAFQVPAMVIKPIKTKYVDSLSKDARRKRRKYERPKHASDISRKRDSRSFAATFLEGYSTSGAVPREGHRALLEDLPRDEGEGAFLTSSRDERKP